MTVAAPAALKVIAFRLGDLLLGISIDRIREINRNVVPTPVPAAPAAVRGVANLRGEVITVLDLRTLLGLPVCDDSSHARLLVIDSEDESIGLIVDQVADVFNVESDDRAPLPANVAGVDSRFFQDVVPLRDELLVILDIDAVLAAGSGET